MPDYTVKADVDTMLRANDKAGIRSAIGVGTTDAPTFLAQTLTGQSLTGTQATSLVDLAATWNTTGTPSALKLNVIDTASNAASKLLDLQVGGVSKFNVGKTGHLTFPTGNAGPWIITGQIRQENSLIILNSGGLFMSNTNVLRWSESSNAEGGIYDLYLTRDAAGILAQRNGGSTQAFRLYNATSATPLTDWDRASLSFTSGNFRIAAENSGTTGYNTARGIEFVTGGVARWQISAAGDLLASTTNSFDIGANAGNRPRNIYAANSVTAGFVDSTGDVRASARIEIRSKLKFASPVNGTLTLTDVNATFFDLLQLGGTTSAFPAIKRNGTGIDIVLANDSGYAPLATGSLTSSSSISAAIGSYVMWGGGTSSRMSAPSNGVIQFTNAATTSFTRLELGEADMGIMRGAGTPENIVTAKVGSIYLRTDGGSGSSFYVKESGVSNTGWVAK